MDKPRSFEAGNGALWLRYDVPALDATSVWYLMLEGAAFTNRADLYQPDPAGQWTDQKASDHLPVANWSHPDRMPVFSLNVTTPGRTVWLRLENFPAPVSASLRLVDARSLQALRDQSLMLIGGYPGFGLLVWFLGWVHVRLYGDQVFLAYVSYVTFMLGFQISFTGLGGLTILPVLLLRLSDAIRRARRNAQDCALVVVALANHAEIVAKEGREMGDRALVVAAAQLSNLVRDTDTDTVCRVADARFAILLEAPYRSTTLPVFAQHIIAKGLANVPALPPDLSRRFRVVTITLPDMRLAALSTEEEDVEKLLARMNRVLDKLDPKKLVMHLPLPAAAPPAQLRSAKT